MGLPPAQSRSIARTGLTTGSFFACSSASSKRRDRTSSRDFSDAMAFPILPCNLCGSQEGLQRDQMKELLDRLQQTHPQLRMVMGGALKNVRPSHLLDVDVARAWNAAGGEASRVSRPTSNTLRVLSSPIQT